ncbi:MAG TPA: hypothetical protein VFF63_08320 [Candidatus Babeliales bacterium]|nr:hypothetical protein [Candidatus Babeliales bacterium]
MTPILVAAALALGPSSSPSPAPTPLSDPCGSILSIVTRPTVTTSVCTVRTGNVLVESGYANTVTTGSGGGSTVTYPQSLVRVGTFDPHLEADVIAPSYNRSSLGDTSASGSSDFGIGAKAELGYGARWLYGVNAAITYPTGSHAFSAGNAQFTGNFNWSYGVNSVVGLSGTMSFNALSGLNANSAPQSYFAFIPSIVAAATLPGPAEYYVEYSYFSRAGPSLAARSLIDTAYLRDFGPKVQLDVEYGFSPTVLNGQKEHYAGAGASFMF